MKKFAILLLNAFLACPLFASEAEIRNILVEIKNCTRNMQFDKILALTATDYMGKTSDGKALTYERISQLPKLTALCNDPDSKLSDLLITAAILVGQKPNEQQIAELKAHDDTPQSKELAAIMKKRYKDLLENQKEMFKQAADSFKIISIKVNGDTATAVYNDFNPVRKRN
ncbi:MAG: hypothetical protein IJW35_05025 [Lentisphaeria bacterium]|nr:hypothetical protein [Lentisphaeria bacterium]